MGKLKKNKVSGITLIALVVSIIVLLILAGVSIQMLTGDNGILTRAGESKKKTDEASILENIKLAYNNAQIGKYTKANENFADTMQEELEKTYGAGNVIVTDNGDGTYLVTINGKIYEIDGEGNVTKQGASIVVGEATFKDASGNGITTKIQGEGTVYIHFTASLTGGTISSVTSTGLTPTLTNGEWVTPVTANGTYEFTITGSSEDGQKTATKSVVVNKFSNLPSGLQIGSVVSYTPTTTNISIWEADLCSTSQTTDRTLNMTGSGADNMTITNWKVLNIDEENETVELISTTPSPNTVCLGKAQGYNNAVYLLNKACNELYGETLTKGGTTYTIEGRNLSIKDIEDRMTDTALTSAHSYGSTATWGNRTAKYTEYKNYPLIYAHEKGSIINESENTNTSAYELWEQITPIAKSESASGDGKVSTATSIQPKQTYWSGDDMRTAFKATKEEKNAGKADGTSKNINYTLLMTNGSGRTATYWLASRCVWVDENKCYFRISCVNGGSIDSCWSFDSSNGGGETWYALRPVISLSSELIKKNGTNNYQVVTE